MESADDSLFENAGSNKTPVIQSCLTKSTKII